ncbi:TPA: hypothetical protein N0F65_007399, partial [Lagenidium giganteum]
SIYQCAVKPHQPVKISKSKKIVDVPDNNQGSYSSGLITLDAASQLNGSQGFGSITDGYIVLPYVITMKNIGANDMAAAAHRFCLAPKCGVWNFIDALEVERNGQQLINMKDYKLYWNNIPCFSTRGTLTTTTTTLGDTGANTFGWPTLKSGIAQSIAQQHGRGAFIAGLATAGSIMGTWYYMLKIRLTDLHPIFKEDYSIWLPTLNLSCDLELTLVASGRVMSLEYVMTASNTVPFIVSSATSSNAMNSVLHATNATTLRVAFGPLMNSLTTLATASNYFPFTTSLKTRRYLDCYAQYFPGREGTGVSTSQQNDSFNFQLSGTWKNVKHVAVIPFSETSSGHFASATAQQFQSPFNSAPWTCQAGASIRAFQAIDYGYEQFMDEFGKINAINGDHSRELTNGLLDLPKWSTVNRVLIADCSRFTDPDVPQSVNVAGVNGSRQGTNVLIIVLFEKAFDIDRLTGEVARH